MRSRLHVTQLYYDCNTHIVRCWLDYTHTMTIVTAICLKILERLCIIKILFLILCPPLSSSSLPHPTSLELGIRFRPLPREAAAADWQDRQG